MSNLTQVSPGSVERPDVALKEDLEAIAKVASDASAQAKETADFLETRVPEGRTINDRPLNEDIHLSAEDLDTYTRQVIDEKINAVASSGYNPVHVNGKLLDRDIILAAGDVGAYSAEEVDTKFDGLIPASRTVNGHALTDDVTLVAGDVDAYTKSETDSLFTGLVPTTRTINGVPLDADVTLLPADLGVLAEADAVPRTFTINGEPMTGEGIQIAGGDGYSRTEVDEKLNQYLSVQNNFGLGITPQVITAGKLAESAQGSGFFAYEQGDDLDADGNPIKTNMEDRPSGSTSGKIMVMATGGDANVVSALAFPDDVNGVFFRKGTKNWEKLGDGPTGSLPYPNVWAPLNDSLLLTAGHAPYDTLVIGSDTLDLHSKSVTFSRASIATYKDNAGQLCSAEVDEARFEHDGLLIEGAVTNGVVYSNSFEQWTLSTAAQVALGAAASPQEVYAMNAAKLSLKAASGVAGISGAAKASAFTLGKWATFSVFVRKGERSKVQISTLSLGSTVYANFDLAAGVVGDTSDEFNVTSSIEEYFDSWYRCSVNVRVLSLPSNGSDVTMNINLIGTLSDSNQPTVTGTVGDGVYIYGAQAEALPRVSSYIPTSGAPVKREIDLVSLNALKNWGKREFTVSAEIHVPWVMDLNLPTVNPTVFATSGDIATGTDYSALTLSTGSTLSAQIGDPSLGATKYTANGIVPSERTAVGMRYNGGIAVSSGGALSAVTAVPYAIGNTAQRLLIGSSPSASNPNALFGHVRNFRIWLRALQDTDMKGLR